MTTKKPNVDTGATTDAQDGAPAQEPIIIKDRSFWGKKDKAHKEPTEAGAADDEATKDTEVPDELQAELISQAATIASLRQSLADKEARLNATVAQYKEALEEFEGIKQRLKRDVAKDVAKGRRDILVGLLEVVDNLERALSAAKEASGVGSKEFKGFFDGVCMVREQFDGKLAALGVSRVAALGKPFDPQHFEAISTVPVATAAEHDTVVGVVRDAYLMDNDTLRHGIVAVGKHQG